MRRLLTWAITITFLAAPGMVFATGYSYNFAYSNNGGYKNTFVTLPFADVGPGYDYESAIGQYLPTDIAIATYKEYGKNGWNGPTEIYDSDCRAYLQPGKTDIIGDIYLWAGTAVAPRDLQLWINHYWLDAGLTYTLRLVQIPVGITYTGPTQWGLGHGTISLPFFATDDFSQGYMFQAEITAVPEPSSLLALAGGMAGLGGFALKRRKV